MADKEEKTEISQSQIDKWKREFGEVFCVEVGDKMAYLKRPSRQALGAAIMVSGGDNIKHSEVLLNNCWLGGDEVIKTNDAYFLGVANILGELIDVKTATLKKV